MKINLNNRETVIDGYEEITVTELLKVQKFTFPNIIVKINGKLIKKPERDTAIIKDGDKVDAIHMVSGG